MTITRRRFLQGAGAGLLALSISRLAIAVPRAAAAESSLPAIPDYRAWEDLYRKQWTWDSVARGTHTMTNCVAGCSWDLYVKDGMVWREEQHSPYTASSPGLPDFNPRGCQKGACGSVLMHSPSRVRYPLRRVGERGEDRWERISWDDALDAVAKALSLHRGARRLAIAIELREAGWTPSPRLAGRWDDPQGKHRNCPAWRALEIARRDGERR